ncbi:MAG TPA: heparan-alpha-glucosaminide N-acetyltransferase domain-containing protein [Acidimicrobiales bacterium]|nr:heparan-alpha-glucosaminide N-acetyltransferase domain-containing protein [Acidimicrobiales bacterium]
MTTLMQDRPAESRAESVPPAPTRRRLLSLDALRGATIAAMVLVNDPATGPPYLYHQLTHSPWDGWTFADTIFPAFLFMVGVSMAFSLPRHGDRRGVWARIARRVVLLFALGLLVNGFPLLLGGGGSVLGHLRIMGVLQRIALAYLIAAAAVLLLRVEAQVVLVAALLIGYWALLTWVPVPGHGRHMLTPSGSLAAWVDRTVLGSAHMYGGGRPGYDPEGLLGSLPAAAGVLIGHWAGLLLRSRVGERVKVAAMVVSGLLLLAVGEGWSHALPINKRMWTSSFVALMSGWSVLALALCHLLFDHDTRPARWISAPLRVLGANAILIYVGSELSAAALAHYHHLANGDPSAPIPFWIWHDHLAPHFGPSGGALVYACALLGAWWLVLAVLHRLGWYLRV